MVRKFWLLGEVNSSFLWFREVTKIRETEVRVLELEKNLSHELHKLTWSIKLT